MGFARLAADAKIFALGFLADAKFSHMNFPMRNLIADAKIFRIWFWRCENFRTESC